MIINGSVKLQKSSFVSLIVNGSAEASEVTFTKKLTVNGSLKVIDSTFHDVTSSGSASFTQCKCTGLVQTFGAADFIDSEIESLEVTNASVELHNCMVTSIVVHKFSFPAKFFSFFGYTQKIILHDTVILGDIVFVGGNGIVELYGVSQVKGNVIGGKIIQE